MGNIREHIDKAGCLFGTFVSSDSTNIAEAIAMAGIDWMAFDLEHSNLSLDTVQKQIQAVAGRAFTAIRIENPELVFVKRALETRCDAIIVPHVNSAAVAKAIVDAGKYSPMGNRSIGAGRAAWYGLQPNFYSVANAQTSIIIQIEHIKAVNDIDEIMAVPGIDGLFLGPYDLSSSMGLIGQVQHPDVLRAIEKVKLAAKRADLPLGTFVWTDTAARELIHDFQFILIGTDIGRVIQTTKNTIQAKETTL